MAVWSQIQKSALYGELRIDAEFYKPDYLNADRIIREGNHSRLGDLLASLYRYPTFYGFEFVSEGVPCLKGEDIEATGFVRPKSGDCVTEGISKRFPLTIIQNEDLIISVRGLVGKVGLVGTELQGAQISPNLIRAKVNKKIDPLYLWCFLNSSFGLMQFDRYKMRTSQETIVSSDIKNIIVPLMDEELQKSIRQHVLMAREKKQSGEALIAEAEAILTAALGLDRVDLTPLLFYEDTFAHAAARLDAEYFSPRMQRVIKTLSRDGLTIGNVAPLAKRAFKPVAGQPFDYIEIADINTSGTAESKTVPGEDAASRATWIVKPGDIITSTVRPIRRLSAAIMPEQDGFVCSSGFAVLRPRDIEPEVLLTYLRLPLVAELLDLHTTASMYPAISTADLLRIPVSLPNTETRAAIIAKVRKSFAARAESLRLLDEAKQTVEAAILGTRKEK